MTYSEVFGGGTINPAQRTYLSLVTAVDVTLQWPINTVGGDNVAADIIDVNATAPGVNVNLSDARQVSKGFTSLFVNVGSQDFEVLDALGTTIVSPAIGTAWFIYLTDNGTEDGTWATFQLGATVSVADAAALAGAGLQQILTTLNQSIPPTLTGVTPITWTDANRALMTIWTGGVGILNLPTVASVGSDWFAIVRNEGSGTLTLTPVAGTIDGASTLVMNPGDSAIVVTDGMNWYTVGLGGTTTVGFDFVQIDVSGSGDFILSGVQLNRISYQFIGTLTGNRKIVVPSTIQQYWIDNSTAGAFSLEVATAAQITPIPVIQNNRQILYCNGTDVIDAETGTFTPPVLIGQGGTSAVTAAGAMDNLGVGRIVDTAANSGLGGGGNLGADLALVLDVDNLPVQLTVDPLADVIAFYDDDAMSMAKTPIANIGGLTIEEEGTPLAALADTLNFTGGIVTASGAGATKTINIPIDASTAANRVLRADGAGGWVEEDNVEITNGGLLTLFSIGSGLRFASDAIPTEAFTFLHVTTSLTLTLMGGAKDVVWNGDHHFVSAIRPRAITGTPAATFAGYGALYSDDETPRILKFVDENGVTTNISRQLKVKQVSTTRVATGVLDDPELSGWDLDAGYWRFYGSIIFTVTPGNGGIDLNWSTIGGSIGVDFGTILTRDDTGLSVGGCIEGAFIPSNISDLTITYAVRNDQTRAFIHGAIEVLTDTTVGFQWAPRLAASQTVGESSWIMFQRMET